MARGQKAALEEYVVPLRQALSCVTRNQLIWQRAIPTGPFLLSLPGGLAERLRGEVPILLRFWEEVDLVHLRRTGRWQPSRRGYEYALLEERGEREEPIFQYHWHPFSSTGDENKFPYPHLHVYGRADIGPVTFRKLHLPTGVMVLHDVIRLAITELQVRPIERTWEEILTRSKPAGS